MDQLDNGRVFSKIYLWSDYHQIKVKPEDVLKIAFRTRHGHYKYSVMQFYVTNVPCVFMKYMNKSFHQYLDKFVVVFIDDILIYLKTDEEYLKHLRIMPELLKENQLYVKLSKCEFWLRGVGFLGHVIFGGGLAVNPSKVDDVYQWETPKYVMKIISFLGLAGHYCKFIEGFSKLGIHLTQLT